MTTVMPLPARARHVALEHYDWWMREMGGPLLLMQQLGFDERMSWAQWQMVEAIAALWLFLERGQHPDPRRDDRPIEEAFGLNAVLEAEALAEGAAHKRQKPKDRPRHQNEGGPSHA